MRSVDSISSLSAKTGIGGLVSGMDIDELVENLTAASRQRIFKQQQKVQKLEWKQTAYRSVIKALSEFQKSYLDILSPTNFRSSSFFNTVKATSSSPAISVSSTAMSSEGTITIDSIDQLATNQTVSSSAKVSKPLAGTIEAATAGTLTSDDISALLTDIGNKSIYMTLDGKFKIVTFDSAFIESANDNLTAEGLSNAFQSLIDRTYGIKNPDDRIINVTVTGDRLAFEADGSQVTLNAVNGDTGTLAKLGFTDGQSNKLSLYEPMYRNSFSAGLDDVSFYNFSINSVDFSFYKAEPLTNIISKINASNAGVTVSYSSITDKFTMTAKESGIGENIIIEETEGNLMTAFGLTAEGGAQTVYGRNALLTVNGQEISRSSNNFVIDGVNIELLTTADENQVPITITMKEDSSGLLEPIKKFIGDYNTMIDMINGLVKESVYSDFQPLSDEQKDEMSEKEIEKWEEKAKSGILRSDNILRGIASKFQTAMMSAAKENGITLYQMGIISAGYQENGKLKIDNENLLKEALRTRGAEIKELFTSAETGLANVLNEVINGAIKTAGVEDTRGTLVDMAGVASTSSEQENSIAKTIKKTKDTISAMQDRLTDEETRLWRKFTAMETALQRLNEQSAFLTQFTFGAK